MKLNDALVKAFFVQDFKTKMPVVKVTGCGVVYLQCLFLLWCMCSASWNGSDMIYHRLIRPFVLKHQKKIDDALDQAAEKLKDGKFDVTASCLIDIASTARRECFSFRTVLIRFE